MTTKLEIDYEEYATDANAQVAYVSSKDGGGLGVDLFAHYKMNDNLATGVVLENISGYDGALNVDTNTRSVTGKIDKALEFRGTDIIRIPFNSQFNLSNKAWSMFTWVSIASSASGQPVLISQENGWAFYVSGDVGGTLTLYLGDLATNIVGGAGVFAGGTYHIGISFNGISTYTFWVNGVPYTITGQSPITDNAGDIFIGNDPRVGYEYYWEDDVRFYDRDMSGYQSTVDAIWNGGNGTEDDSISSSQLIVYSESTIKTQGSYSLKGWADVGTSAGGTLTKTFSPAYDLSKVNDLSFDFRSSRTGSNIKFGLSEGSSIVSEITPNIVTADTFQTVKWSLFQIADIDKANVDTFIITILDDSVVNTFYLDNFQIAQAIDLIGIIN